MSIGLMKGKINMKIVVLVNNYNYGVFIEEALQSLEMQSKKPDRVIIVDDGSTDDSVDRIKEFCSRNENFHLIDKKNAGQLSCFNAAIPLINDNDLVFFLDSDDLYPFDYIECVLSHVDEYHEFYSATTIKFQLPELPIKTAKISTDHACSIPISSSLTRRYGAWVGSPTSALALKGAALKQILPYGDERLFRTRADDVLIFSASILGHGKKHIPSVAIAYRVHGKNNYFGKVGKKYDPIRFFTVERLFNEMCKRAGLDRYSSPSAAFAEVQLIPASFYGIFFIPSKHKIFIQKIMARVINIFGSK